MTGNSQGRVLTGKQDVVHVAASVHSGFVYAGLAYLAFVIYGSLVPLDFHHRSWDSAWQAFMAIPYLDLGISSRADWVANILLFIPLTFIWLGVLWHHSSLVLKLLASFVILMLAVALDISIEFTQLFFPPRTVSLNDIYAETLGACMGITLWWVYGEKLSAWLDRWASVKGNTGMAERLLQLYLFGLFTYNLLPLDLTLSPVEIFHKWREGRVILIPFSYAFDDLQQALYGLISDVASWMPVAFLWRLSSKRSASFIWLYVVGAAVLLEFLQLFVYTRISNVTQIFTAGMGAALGLLLANLVYKNKFEMVATGSGKDGRATRLLAWLAATLFWVGVIVTVFWYPFDFHYSRELVAQHLPDMLKVPFVTYYYGTEYRAITEVLHKTGFFFPLGVLLGYGVSHIRDYFWRPIAGSFAVLTLGLTAFGIELGQVFLPGKYADITDCVLELSGGLAGYWAVMKLTARMRQTQRDKTPRVRVNGSDISAGQGVQPVMQPPVDLDNHA